MYFSLSELMTQAFFDLRKNYGFRWKLSLAHVLNCLLNYGADEAAIFNVKFYQKHLEKHIEAVRRSDQKVHSKYQLPHLAEFVKRRRAEDDGEEEILSEGNFKFCLVKFIELLTDFSAGQPNHLNFRLERRESKPASSDLLMVAVCCRVKNNWSDQIIFLYILLIVGTDKRVITDSEVREAIRTGVHYHLDSFR